MNRRIYQGHFSRKRFGQNFLIDSFIIDNIISSLNPKPGQVIVEIGPGLGALTLPLSQYIDNIIAIELDDNLSARLVAHPELKTKLTMIQKNAITVNFEEIAKKKGQSIRVFGNLPYNISTPLMFHLFSYNNIIVDIHLMLQEEVVNRLVARLNTKEYGRLSVIAQYYCKIIPILAVSASSFLPTPKVNSAFVHLIPYKQSPYPICDIKLLNRIITQAFNQRRKTIHNSLSNLFSIRDFEKLGINPKHRAENISVENYCKLACTLDKTMI